MRAMKMSFDGLSFTIKGCANSFRFEKRQTPLPLPFFNIFRPMLSKYEGAIEQELSSEIFLVQKCMRA